MSRPWILGIVCCCLIASSAAVGRGQEYLDLYDDQTPTKSSSLADKLLSLKDKFRRDPSLSDQSPTSDSQAPRKKSAARSTPRAPRYRNTAQSSLRSRRIRSNNASQNNASKSARQPATSKTATRQAKDRSENGVNSKQSPIAARIGKSSSLPGSKIFSRSHSPLPPPTQIETKRLTRATNLPRAGTAIRAAAAPSRPAAPRIARKSPTTSRATELDAALADLLKPQPPSQIQRPKVKKSPKSAARKSPLLAVPIVNTTFDLRQALLDDESDSIATEVAKAMQRAVESAAPSPVTEPTVAAASAEKLQSAEQSPTLVAAKTAEKVDTPAVDASPKLESNRPVATKPIGTAPVASQPTVDRPADSQPLVIEPAVVAAAPQPAITIAEPRPSPSFPSAGPRRAVIDPFDSAEVSSDPFRDAAKHVFGTRPQATNPMRSFLPVTEPAQAARNIARPEQRILQTTQQPVIVSHVEGPRSILVGREATYQVTLENTSDTQASELSTEISVPEWAELVDAMSTSGVVERRDQGAKAGLLEWKLSELAPRSSQALRLRLIPRSGRPLQLGVRWSQAPAQSQATVEVQEPKLELAISGPQEVRFGKPQRYRLTLHNPGSGLTEHVSLRLIPPGGDPQSATTQKIGDLKPGEVRDLDLELTAREAGELLIQAYAVADGGLKADASKSVLCRKPELSVDWRGPDKKYVGTVAAYYFRIRNPGTAVTEPIDMSIKLPVGAEFVSASDGYAIDATTGVVSWRLAGIDVKEEQFMQLRCKIDRAGKNKFKLHATTSDGELSDSKDFHTEVVAIADLKLEVTDPQGPLPLGEMVVYEIRVRNRGTTNAENINVVGLFSEGIDPTTVEGAQFTLRDGRVSFHPIKNLPAGREVQLRIHAKANKVGTHIFRTEVVCPKLDIKLAAEETTRFFEDEHRWEDGETPYSAERAGTLNR